MLYFFFSSLAELKIEQESISWRISRKRKEVYGCARLFLLNFFVIPEIPMLRNTWQ